MGMASGHCFPQQPSMQQSVILGMSMEFMELMEQPWMLIMSYVDPFLSPVQQDIIQLDQTLMQVVVLFLVLGVHIAQQSQPLAYQLV
jgi:hypothetical protein